MLKTVLTSELKKHFPNKNIQFGGGDDVIATIPPIHHSWKPIVICYDEDEVTVFYGDFTHKHFGYYGESIEVEVQAQSIATDVIEAMTPVFEDRLEFYKRLGSGGFRVRGSQGQLSKFLFGENGVVWSGN
ncbi:hypothetical protein JQV27_03455 [Sulfitobacter mediterraneus]|jgi:hypothetical protein|uniref:hypothetical protein n=1 Tax=Sulfitobacter mediterraneus TaxID=83219 RepID=UPI000EA283F6|nr:hypothetical protein [Sulfitobacter mediterraneus]MBM1631878.1 hypothetical protein [Sulfitobacter mediterraneus]MBM1639693.1 hypothetical protein [Sulfitobacter mediterraneus]MBM1643742.1 hypothetical protein [Sulfitobacter mediterraneus]MBM1647788.1 hypothetical protein [Sulfitobacter mediterraneus]MBM1651833.1 hypothetical protein [Sulfitobacter mediterraneus]